MTQVAMVVPYEDGRGDLCSVIATWDRDANVWVGTNTALGVLVEADTLELLIKHVQAIAPDLIEANRNTPVPTIRGSHATNRMFDTLADIGFKCHTTAKASGIPTTSRTYASATMLAL